MPHVARSGTFAAVWLLAVSTVLAQTAEKSAGWPQFLGPTRNGISAETGLISTWPADGPPVVWRADGGVGMSGLAIQRGRVITLVQRDGKQWVVAHDAASGRLVWQTAVAPAYRNGMGNGPRATPAIAGDHICVFTGEGILAVLNFQEGNLAWATDVMDDLEGQIADYGMASSPLIIGQTVVVTPGCPGASVVAYEIRTGKLAWKSGDDPAGYSSPALLNLSGRQQLVVFNGAAAVGLVPESGKQIWRYPFETNFNCNIVTPLAVGNHVFLSAGENHGSVMLAVDSAGKSAVSEVWSSLGNQSVLRNEWQTSILLDGYLYGFDNVGAAGPVSHLTCVSAETGKRVWQKTRFGKGNLIAADGKLFLSTMAGELVVLNATPKAYEELGRMVVTGQTRQAPALADGRLYLRDDQEIVCIDVRQSKSK